MLDRESTFADPEVIKLLQTRFVPVAIDQAYQRRQQDAEGRFYQKIANQGPRKVGAGTTQGLYAASGDGSLLGFTNNRGPEKTLQLMQTALAKHRPGKIDAIPSGRPDLRFNPKLPEGGLIVRVNSKVLGGYPETDDPWRRIFQESIGRDNLWIRGDEQQALLNGQFPASLINRIARYHLVDNTRGEPPMWEPEEIRVADVRIDEGLVRGSFQLATKSGDRAYRAELLGFVEIRDGKVSRFDLVVNGEFLGQGQYTGNAPKGWFPFAVAFRLADGSDTADQIPPQASRGWVEGYLR